MSAPEPTKRKPDRTDVCIIGAGASGGTAAKVLTEAGLRVVALERGPWWKPEQFSADELANVHRYNLWPDPLINPRTFRASADEDPVVQLFCPVPQMVGGGTAHWTGWLPRMTENEFRPKTIYGEVPGANLADWPITYQELEPYYDKVEWAFGVSGQAGANTYEGPRSRGYPCPPLPPTRYNQKFHEGCAKLGYNSFPTPSAALSCPYNGWPATNQSAFAQQHGDPTGTRGNALTRFIPAALATGRYDLRPDCYVQEITVDAQGRARSAVYWDADGDTIEQEADLFILACGAIESARLLLLSQSSKFPNGLANGSDVVGRNATFHEYSAAIGAFEDPIYGWAGGGYVGASTFEFMEHAEGRDFVGGCHVASAGVGIPLPISFSLPDTPTWGQAAKDAGREFFNHTMAVGLVLHDLPQETNRVELDDQVKDAWGLPVARITHKPHPNDLAQGRWIIDRNAEILEAAGATKVWRVYIDKVTGNCSHQHSTLRMGNNPSSSVLNKDCRAHEVDNLYAVDGGPFPTSTGVNPTLTIMANAWRVADSIAARRGSPDSSIVRAPRKEELSMRLAYQTNTWGGVFGHPAGVTSVKDLLYLANGSTEEAMRDIAAAGYSGFELFEGNLVQYADREDELRRLMEELHLELVGVYSGANFIFPEILGEELHKIRRSAELAAQFGATHFVVGGGAVRASGTGDADYALLAHGLDRVADLATGLGLTPSFHPHLGTCAQTPEQIARVFDLTAIGFCPDTAHLDAAGGDSAELIRIYGNRIPYVHLKDYAAGEFVPLGEGELDFDRILSSLQEIAYDGWITIELDAYAGSKQEAARNSRIFLEGRQQEGTMSR